ncbi:hypothetical protein [Sutcliffiella rhizosphaerae]|uniref:Uncharacterized protein n=1 Tax=Sutcliffiella rhizosphaerae TaxID=2880967 RepID=A0ABM8YLS1_9BACI|nr:hypothetical protein [Sutcliffiella rhizosphaerae]CAG9620884.1 hypothetical protein BACCIP111883_01655 [Sutcliffiella rhizosphaerae]
MGIKQVYRIDERGLLIEPILIESTIVEEEEVFNIPEDCIEVEPPNGLYMPLFDGDIWIESMSQEEIDELKNKPRPKTELEILTEENAELWYAHMLTTNKLSQVEREVVELWYTMMVGGV